MIKKNHCTPFFCLYLKSKKGSFNMKTYFTDSPLEKQMMRIPRQPKRNYSNFVKKSFRNQSHKTIFEREIQHYQKQGYVLSNRFTAALYILSANFFLWKSAKYHIKPNYIDFDRIDIKGAEPRSYTMFKAAKDIVYKTSTVALSDMIERSVTDNELFMVLLIAMYISRYGIDCIESDKK